MTELAKQYAERFERLTTEVEVTLIDLNMIVEIETNSSEEEIEETEYQIRSIYEELISEIEEFGYIFWAHSETVFTTQPEVANEGKAVLFTLNPTAFYVLLIFLQIDDTKVFYEDDSDEVIDQIEKEYPKFAARVRQTLTDKLKWADFAK